MRLLVIVGVYTLFITAPVCAEVAQSGPNGFVSKHRVVLAAPPAAAYRALVEDVHLWWDASHSFGGSAAGFSIEAKAGGCFCEDVEGVSVEHMRVVNAQAGKRLVLRGGLGPLQEMAVTGSMTFALQPTPEGSVLLYTYSVGGYLPGGLAALAEPVDRVQLGQLERLAKHIASLAGDSRGGD